MVGVDHLLSIGLGQERKRGWRFREKFTASLAFDDVYRQSPSGGLLVLVLHVCTGLPHGLNDFIQADAM